MTDDKLGRALRSVGDGYVRDNPADFEALREGVQRRRWRKRFLTGFGTAAVTATAVIALVFVFSSDPKDEARVTSGGPEGLEITASFQVGPVTEVAAGLESAFVVNPVQGSVTRVDASGGEVWVAHPGPASDIIHTKTEIWVSVREDNTIYKIDRGSGAVVPITVRPFTGPTRLHVGEFAVRVVTAEGVVKIPKDTMIPELLFSADVRDIAFGPRGFWVLETTGVLKVIDPDTGAVAPLETDLLPAVQSEITYLKGALWFASPSDTILTRIDETTGTITGTTSLPGGYIDVDAGPDAMWVLVETVDGGGLVEVDPATGGLSTNLFEFDTTPRDLSTDDAGVWVTLADGRVVRVED